MSVVETEPSLFTPQLAVKLAGLSALADQINQDLPQGKPRRLKPKKIRKPLGPFQTNATEFERGKHRQIVIERITPAAIVFRRIGLDGEFTVPIGVAFAKAVCIAADFDAGPRGKRR